MRGGRVNNATAANGPGVLPQKGSVQGRGESGAPEKRATTSHAGPTGAPRRGVVASERSLQAVRRLPRSRMSAGSRGAPSGGAEQRGMPSARKEGVSDARCQEHGCTPPSLIQGLPPRQARPIEATSRAEGLRYRQTTTRVNRSSARRAPASTNATEITPGPPWPDTSALWRHLPRWRCESCQAGRTGGDTTGPRGQTRRP